MSTDSRIAASATLVLASIALILFVVNACLIYGVQGLQRTASERQVAINNGMQLSQLNTELVRALGTAVVNKKDEKIKAMLAEQGITVQTQPAAAAKKPAAAAAPSAQ